MQEGGQAFHNEENSNRENSKEGEDYEDADKASNVPARQTHVHHHGPQDFGQLCMG